MGKAHKKYEYGWKASVVLNQNTRIFIGVMTFKANVYDCHTLEDAQERTRTLIKKTPKTIGMEREAKRENGP